MEDNFSMDGDEEGSGSTVCDVEQQMKLYSVATHLLLCGLVSGRGLGTPTLYCCLFFLDQMICLRIKSTINSYNN